MAKEYKSLKNGQIRFKISSLNVLWSADPSFVPSKLLSDQR